MKKAKTREQLTIEDYRKFLDENQAQLHTHFPKGHLLSDPDTCLKAILLITYYRRNLHRFATEYFGFRLHWYQLIVLYFLGIVDIFVDVASRATAKSFIIGVYAVCKAVLYPGSLINLSSGTRGEAALLINKKIIGELIPRSARLRAEIEAYSDNETYPWVKFKNGSEINVITLGKRGNRSTDIIAEEARGISKAKFDEAMSPTAFIRQPPFINTDYYSKEKSPKVFEQVYNNSTEIYITSSVEDTHWIYTLAKDVIKREMQGEKVCFLAFDYAVSIQCGIRSVEQLLSERRRLDPTTWQIEYENAILRSNTKAFFNYDMVRSAQVVKKAFYPRRTADFINKKPNPYSIPKQKDEVRIVTADIAFIDRAANDNSCYGCLRLLPDSEMFGNTEQKTYSVQVPYLEAMKGMELRKQAIRLRQLYADFDADYFVIDTRNGGPALIDFLCKTLYDDERCIEYAPIKVMNDDALNRACTSSAAPPVIYAISASAALNSKIALNFKGMLSEGKAQLLVQKDEGFDEVRKFAPEYTKTEEPEVMLFYENPYLQTMLLFSEMINLEYEKTDLGLVKIKERPSMTKDRYTSISYGCWFAAELARDLLREEDDWGDMNMAPCVSTLNF